MEAVQIAQGRPAAAGSPGVERAFLDAPNPRQREFFLAETRFVAYGGARGGGKSWAVRKKAELLALRYDGIRILVLRRSFPELRENHILPIREDLNGLAAYKEAEKALDFPNGSRLKFGYCDTEGDVLQYQGQEYDIIFLDEATQFTEYQFQTLTACLRGANPFPKRFYLTCNPGGPGHGWVKRLFIDRQYQKAEREADYTFIRATVYDNRALLDNDPEYVRMLENLDPVLRQAWLHGDWNVFLGQYFTVWREALHVVPAGPAPAASARYFALDYGQDMLAGYCVAVAADGRATVYKEIYQPNLIISQAAQRVKEICAGEGIELYFGPIDLRNRRQESGKSAAEIFAENGVYLTLVNPDRVSGWLELQEWLRPGEDGLPKLRVMRSCPNLIRSLPLLQRSTRNPDDVAAEPHEITHGPDALRYFLAGRPAPYVPPVHPEDVPGADWDRQLDSFFEFSR